MKKLTYIAICCLFASASFGMNGSQNINSSFELLDSFEQNVPFAEAPNVLSSPLFMSIEDFDDNVVLRSSVETQQDQGYGGYQPNYYYVNMDYAVTNESNGDVTTMTLRHDPETNAQYGYALSGQDVWNNQPNLQQSYSMSEDSETYTDDSFCYFVDESSSDSDDEVDFLNSYLHRRPFEFM